MGSREIYSKNENKISSRSNIYGEVDLKIDLCKIFVVVFTELGLVGCI